MTTETYRTLLLAKLVTLTGATPETLAGALEHALRATPTADDPLAAEDAAKVRAYLEANSAAMFADLQRGFKQGLTEKRRRLLKQKRSRKRKHKQ